MKRAFVDLEISDEEWDIHQFQSSRVLKTASSSHATRPKPPPIESFAFKSRRNPDPYSDDDCVEITGRMSGDNLEENLEDEGAEEAQARLAGNSRGRRFVVEDDQDGDGDGDFDEVYDIKSTSEEEFEEENAEDDDLVGRALHKCARISEELKRELYGTAATSCERYAEVEASTIKIVTQV